VVVVVVTPASPSVEDVVTIPTDVETPLNVDAASITTGVSVVADESPVVVSVLTTTLVTCDVDMLQLFQHQRLYALSMLMLIIHQNILFDPMQWIIQLLRMFEYQ